MAVLVVDLNEGLKPQTLEAIEILKQYKTPFIIAANKIDLIPGWQKKSDLLVSSLNQQAESTINALNHKLYELVGKLYELGINAERFDKVTDYTKQVAIVPISAKTNQGIPELVMVLMGLSQKFLEKELEFCKDKPGKAVVLEVREKKGLGCVLDLILYDGLIKKNDQIIIAGRDEPIVTKVKCIFEDDKEVKESCAASSVTLVASDLKGVVSGMPVEEIKDNLSELKVEIQKQVEEVFIETDEDGVVIKADSVGSLEAVIKLLKENKIKIKYANIGKINKKDIATACSSENKIDKVILGFNLPQSEIIDKDIKIITSDIIYTLFEDYDAWKKEQESKEKAKDLENLPRPFKVKILPHYIFRQSNPAVVGVDVLGGIVKTGTDIMKLDGKKLTEVKSIQSEGKNVSEAEKGKQVAISLPNVTVGRNIFENDILISDLSEDAFVKLKNMKKYLNEDEIAILKEISEIKRDKNPMWGV